MKLKDIQYIFESKMDWVERCYEDNPEYWKGVATGVYNVLRELITFELDKEDVPKYKLSDKAEKIDESLSYIGTINIFDKDYKVYTDDYGQCECIEIEEGDIQSMGAYNFNSERSMVYEVLSHLYIERMNSMAEKYKSSKL